MRFRILSCVLWVSILGASQAFEGGAAWKADTLGILRTRLAANGSTPFQAGSNSMPSPRLSRAITGVAPSRHLQTLEAPPPGPWIRTEVTGYSHSCTLPRSGKEHATPQRAANGNWPLPGVSVAASRDIPFGTILELRYDHHSYYMLVEDRGAAVTKNKVDIFFARCADARTWGRKWLDVRVRRLPIGGDK